FEGVRKVGGSHLKGTLTGGGGRLAAIGFGWAERAPWAGPGQPPAPVDCAFRLEENEYQGTVSLQARIVALTPARAPQPSTPPSRRAAEASTSAEPSSRRAAGPSS
ncbi:MAG: hypothetical protein KBF47_17925, partial [Gemmatimonadales bacterium]|nr:hypothetical protein [Gemmatimonadales bacterium]